jgi:hypothetical protein
LHELLAALMTEAAKAGWLAEWPDLGEARREAMEALWRAAMPARHT